MAVKIKSGMQSKEIEAAIAYGIDISMLVCNLSKSYTERIKRHQIAVNTVAKFRKAKEEK